MSDVSLRPRSPTELVDAAFQLYRRDPLQFIAGLALVYVPWLLIVSAIGFASGARDVAGITSGGVTSSGGVLVGVGTDQPAALLTAIFMPLGSVIVYALASGVVSVMAADVYFGRGADLGKALRTVRGRLGTLILGMIAFGAALVLGTMLLIIPGFYFFARYFAIKQTILIEDLGVNAASERCSHLTEGHKRHVLNTMGLVFLLNIAITIGANLVATMIPSQVIQVLAATCVSVVVYPIVGITETLLYYDVRIRRDGFDIEYLAAAGAASPSASEPAATTT